MLVRPRVDFCGTARRVLIAAAATVTLCVAATGARAATAQPAPAAAPSAAHLIETLGLHVAPQPVRERQGWHSPRIVLVNPELHELLPQLQQAAPHAKLIEMSAASARELAGADAALGVCSAEVLSKARQLQWIQWLAAGVERCRQQPLGAQRRILLTNLQRTMGQQHVALAQQRLLHPAPH